MNAWFLNFYIEISVLIAVADGILAIKSILKNRTTGRYLGFACAGAAVVDISYLISILNNDYRCVSVMSSIYFVNIDVMLICLLIFTVYFTKGEFTKSGKTGLSQILCKHRNAVQIEQNLFKAEVAQAAAALFSK